VRCGIQTRSPDHGHSIGLSPAARRVASVRTSVPEVTPPDLRVAVMYSRSGPSKAYRKVRNPVMVRTPSAIVCLVPPPFWIHAVYRGVRLCENHVRMPIGFDALDHEDMPIAVPGPDPCALKAGNVGRHIRLRHLHVKLVRQRNDGLRIDSCRLGFSVVHPTHGYHHNYHQQVVHVPPEAQPKSRSAMASWRQTHRDHAL
jgi:hypothetical protein